ncbi:MAG: GNAT family protein [Bacteroidales bacterium]|nr:GNAT family protein [Bacteroidales bacterium]
MNIRTITENDLPLRVKWMNHPKIYTSMHYDIPVLLENTLSWYKKNKENPNRIDVVFEDNCEILAMGGLTGIDTISKKAELYIFVNPFAHSKGIGTESTRLLCKYAFENLNLKKVFLVTNETNLSAQKVYEKVGFKLEGRLRKEVLVNGMLEDRFYYGIFSNELVIW